MYWQVRIDQVLISCHDTVLLFKLADMIGFYSTMVSALLGASAGLSKAVVGAHEASQKRFYDLVKQQAVTMLQSAGRYPADLMPPRVAQETLAKLVRLCVLFWLHVADVVSARAAGCLTDLPPWLSCLLCFWLRSARHSRCVQSIHGAV